MCFEVLVCVWECARALFELDLFEEIVVCFDDVFVCGVVEDCFVCVVCGEFVDEVFVVECFTGESEVLCAFVSGVDGELCLERVEQCACFV